MKIAVPVGENKGIDSEVYGHFGSTPMFLLVDSETEEIEELDNSDNTHVPGACNPFRKLGGRRIDAVMVGGIGAGALQGFRKAGIRVFSAGGLTMASALASLKAGSLAELDETASCSGHDAGHECGHA